MTEKQDYFYGVPYIKFIWRGTQSDPLIEYRGMQMNYWDAEDALWSIAKGELENGKLTDSEFHEWISKNHKRVRDYVYEMLCAVNNKN